MPGIPTHFKILELTIGKLKASTDPNLRQIGQLMQDNLPYSYLGAIGSSLADFMPRGFSPLETNNYMNIWQIIFRIIGGTGTDFPGLNAILNKMNNFLDKIQPIADNEDFDALKAMQSEADVINEVAKQLSDLVIVVKDDLIFQIKKLIEDATKPPIMQGAHGDPPKPPKDWTAREFLRWQKTGSFAVALLKEAAASGDKRFIAYAYGYITNYAGNVCGSPFINSIVRGPYRTQWWRHRWIANSVDAWVHGYYESNASMNGDNPSPPYKLWPNLCNAGLHKKIQLGNFDPIDMMAKIGTGQPLPVILTSDFTQLWIRAYHNAYNNNRHPFITEKALNEAYLITWLVLWFQTSGEGLGCVESPPLEPPINCGECTWCDPANPGDNGTGNGPPSPTIEVGVDWTRAIIGILLAILGMAVFCSGGWIDGAAAIYAGIAFAKNSADVNWDKLRCDLYWYRLYVYNGLKAIYDLGSLGGLLYPLTSALEQETQTILLLNIPFSYDSGVKVVRSKVLDSEKFYPSKLWDPGILPTWIEAPDGLYEGERTTAYLNQAYPSFFMDDSAANPLGNGQIRIGGTWPFKKSPATNLPEQPGNAVDNAVDILGNLANLDSLPEWNLDGDRGLSFFTWIFKPSSSPLDDPVSIEPEP